MGVANLLPFVKDATSNTKLSRIGIADKTAAIDVSTWIHKGAYACPELIFNGNQMHQVYAIITNYINNYVELLKSYNVKLIFVFDGMKLPAKQITHQERAQSKAEARRLAEKFLASGNKQEARKQMLRCLDIRFDIVKAVIDYCKKNHIEYIVAPYEADAQLAFLINNKICDFIITEDSDLILYGCSKIIYKLDTSGNCQLYDKSKLHKTFGPRGDEVDFDKFRRMCIMSGCDYLKNIPSVGLQSAKKFFLMTKQDNLRILLPKLSVYLKSPKLVGKVTKEYIEAFIQTESTFKHHIVYDPQTERVRPLEDYPRGKSWQDYPLAGKPFCRVMAAEIVKGNLDLDTINQQDLDSESETEGEEDQEQEQVECA